MDREGAESFICVVKMQWKMTKVGAPQHLPVSSAAPQAAHLWVAFAPSIFQHIDLITFLFKTNLYF
jgi:hypothetical protein